MEVSAFSQGVLEFRARKVQDHDQKERSDPDIITLSSDSEVDDHDDDEGPTITIQSMMSLGIDVDETLKATAKVKDEKTEENGSTKQTESNPGKDSTTTDQNKVSNDKLEPVVPFSSSTLLEDPRAKVDQCHPVDKGERSCSSEVKKYKLMKLYIATVQKLTEDEVRLQNSIIENRTKREKAQEELIHVNMKLAKRKAAKIRDQENLKLREDMNTLLALVATKAKKLEEVVKTYAGVHTKMLEFWRDQKGATKDADEDDSQGQDKFQSPSKSYLMKQIEEMSNLSKEFRAEGERDRKHSSQFWNDFKEFKRKGLKHVLDTVSNNVATDIGTVNNDEINDDSHQENDDHKQNHN